MIPLLITTGISCFAIGGLLHYAAYQAPPYGLLAITPIIYYAAGIVSFIEAGRQIYYKSKKIYPYYKKPVKKSVKEKNKIWEELI